MSIWDAIHVKDWYFAITNVLLRCIWSDHTNVRHHKEELDYVVKVQLVNIIADQSHDDHLSVITRRIWQWYHVTWLKSLSLREMKIDKKKKQISSLDSQLSNYLLRWNLHNTEHLLNARRHRITMAEDVRIRCSHLNAVPEKALSFLDTPLCYFEESQQQNFFRILRQIMLSCYPRFELLKFRFDFICWNCLHVTHWLTFVRGGC